MLVWESFVRRSLVCNALKDGTTTMLLNQSTRLPFSFARRLGQTNSRRSATNLRRQKSSVRFDPILFATLVESGLDMGTIRH